MPRAPFKKKEGPKPMDIELGKRLRVIRTELGFTQEALAVGLGLTFQQVQKYEQGKNRISISTLISMCRVLGVTYELFLHGLDDPARGADVLARQRAQAKELTMRAAIEKFGDQIAKIIYSK